MNLKRKIVVAPRRLCFSFDKKVFSQPIILFSEENSLINIVNRDNNKVHLKLDKKQRF